MRDERKGESVKHSSSVLIGVLIGTAIAIVVIAIVLLSGAFSNVVKADVVCPSRDNLTNVHGVARLYENFLSDRTDTNGLPSDKDIIGAAFDVESCLH
jgi:hypothetical protein